MEWNNESDRSGMEIWMILTAAGMKSAMIGRLIALFVGRAAIVDAALIGNVFMPKGVNIHLLQIH